MSLTNDQISKLDPARQTELLNIIKVIKDNPEKAAEKAFTPNRQNICPIGCQWPAYKSNLTPYLPVSPKSIKTELPSISIRRKSSLSF